MDYLQYHLRRDRFYTLFKQTQVVFLNPFFPKETFWIDERSYLRQEQFKPINQGLTNRQKLRQNECCLVYHLLQPGSI
jgi:hypothetical protein